MKTSDVIGNTSRVYTGQKPDAVPLISIITPTYHRNAEGLLDKCLRSAQNQTFEDFEHIIIDDGSTDGTQDVVLALAEKDARIVYVRHDRNSGLPAVRTNEGIMRARGSAIAFLFDDNVFHKDFLQEAWRALEESGADLVHGEVSMTVATGKPFVLGGWPLTIDLMRTLNTVANGGILVRRDFFDRFGLYDPHLVARRLCDWELWNRSLWLGAKFCHLKHIIAQEGGLVSPNSLGNTVPIDWKAVYGYLQDTRTYADRARRFAPANILDEEILDTDTILGYVRNEREWQTVVDTIYKPFLIRHSLSFDPTLKTNRAASTDPLKGWNPSWSLEANRIRVLFLSNAVPSFVAMAIEAVRAIPGAIVVNCPDWQLSAFVPGDIDIIFVVDGANLNTVEYLQSHRQASTRVIYLSLYGRQSDRATLTDLPSHATNQHIVSVLGPKPPYFPQPGHGFTEEQRETAKMIRAKADLVIAAERSWDENDALIIPNLPQPAFYGPRPQRDRQISYRIVQRLRDRLGEAAGLSSEIVEAGIPRFSDESLSSIILGRDNVNIVVPADMLIAMPRIERIGLGWLAAKRNISIKSSTQESADAPLLGDHGDRAVAAQQWVDWLSSIVSLERLRSCLGLKGQRRLTIDVYLMSELFSGSEAYGLIITQNLCRLGCRVRVRVPEISVYGGDRIAVNDWLQENGIPVATRAPYVPGGLWMTSNDKLKKKRLRRLRVFIDGDRPDLIIASGYIPHLAFIKERPPLIMAMFSASAYDQNELLHVQGHVDGLISDSAWALAPTARIVRAPHAVIRSSVFGFGGGERDRIVAMGRSERPERPFRIAVAGTLQLRKGQREAVSATALLLKDGYNVELHLYGYELNALRSYVDEIDAAIHNHNIIDRVTRHGFVEDSSQIARDNDIVLSASLDESLPQGLLFQMYQGLLGVAVLSGGIDEILVDGETGFLTKDPSPAGIASALRRALDNRMRWAEITERARNVIWKECSAMRMTYCLLELCRESIVLRPSPRRPPVFGQRMTSTRLWKRFTNTCRRMSFLRRDGC
jgi:glycosyltransferase involved in cell wall biosynthesis